MDNDISYCPISYEKFTRPIVLSCGHCIDAITLEKLQNKNECPICKSPNDPTNNRINWILVQYLNLDINDPNKNNIKKRRITASEAKVLLENQMNTHVEKLIDNDIIPKILEKINKLENTLVYKTQNINLRNKLVSILQYKLNYQVKYEGDEITISWV